MSWRKKGAMKARRNSEFVNLNRIEGISYTVAKTKIKHAVEEVTQAHWDSRNTTLKRYKSTISPALYTRLGSAQEIRWRTQMMIGCDTLNATRKTFGRGVISAECPHCPTKPETVDHFLCKCSLYTEYRRPLYHTFCSVYPGRERPFNHIGLLMEPTTKAGIKRHRAVICALNTFLTNAMAERQRRQIMSDVWGELEDAFQEDDTLYDDWEDCLALSL